MVLSSYMGVQTPQSDLSKTCGATSTRFAVLGTRSAVLNTRFAASLPLLRLRNDSLSKERAGVEGKLPLPGFGG
ncbi:hypothetical protein L1887_08073 [Cichorium endivia]|nr:hypothetical protein L1887_08073 [Cichorium endivia]